MADLHYIIPYRNGHYVTIRSTLHMYTFKVINIIVTKYIIICFNDYMYVLVL